MNSPCDCEPEIEFEIWKDGCIKATCRNCGFVYPPEETFIEGIRQLNQVEAQLKIAKRLFRRVSIYDQTQDDIQEWLKENGE